MSLSLLSSFSVLATLFIFAWLIQLRNKNAGWVDVLWAFCTGIIGVVWAIQGNGDLILRIIVASVYALWFSRLGLHLFLRIHGQPEEGRYAHMRKWAQGPTDSKTREAFTFLIFYLMQASWVWLFSLPGWILSQGARPPLWAIAAGLLIIAIAWWGEHTADQQLARFKQRADSRGKTCRDELWQYSRHPNYFFEWVHWFAYPILGWNTPYGPYLWLAPVMVFIFLYWITGIPFTEKQAIRTRGQDYIDYQNHTSMFIPWRKKS